LEAVEMPRRSRLRRRSSGWSDQHIEILRTGLDWFELFRDEIDQHAAWRDLQKEIMVGWLTSHPGTRPWAWWRFDLPAGTRRQRINGLHPHDDPENDLPHQLWYGLPQYQRPCDLLGLYESEASFLKRLSLLTTAELKFLNGVK
jgi:hypothetical protein